MSLSAAVIDALLATGATREQIAAAVKADIAEREAIEAAKLEKKRAGNRERQTRKRERDGNAVSRVTSVTERDERDTPSPVSPLNGFPKPLPNNPPLSPNPDPPIPDGIGPQPDDLIEKPLTAAEVVEAWNERMVKQGFPAVKRLTPTRQKQLKARLRENSIDDWQQAMSALERSPFLRGENDRGWRADFDFLLQPKSFTKLLEGAYDH